MVPIIGLAGAQGSGKSTVARFLVENYGYSYEPFAKPLKRMMEAFGVPPKFLYGTQEEKEAPLDLLCGKSARHAMRTLGTEWGRQTIGDLVWVHHWKRRCWGRLCVADDVRFPNEVDAIHELNGLVVRIEGRGEEFGDHESDRASELKVDAVIYNDGTLQELYDKVLKAVGAT